ncbi:FCD domain-containing protein [Curtobacterium sp. MCPF17_002]|uniref:FadR/GntR family transcriptional regulator n=1 Tax=Curtobacterium sp. MCPF17_002 TaxID=2175645 RepID=UPI000DAAB706|nr:FCD domain-containing protein [Curtobacterium sp. MCPF17_002]WIB77786.1 FCD domain-containing protein [Curtobacterium sp. MCPF17_002]
MTSTFDRVRDELGSAIVAGVLPVGHRDSIDGFVVRTGASRSIVREAVRVLVGCGLLSARRRTGLVVQPAGSWDVTDPLVLGWRLDGPDRARVLTEVRAVRRAVEPAAAAAAAEAVAAGRAVRRHEPGSLSDLFLPDPVTELLASATTMAEWTAVDDAATFLQADRQLHRSVLTLSGNAFFIRLGRVTTRALDERASIRPDVHDVGLHVRLAHAVADGDAEGAASAMLEIIDRTAPDRG